MPKEELNALNNSIIELNQRLNDLHWLTLKECTVGVFALLLTIDLIASAATLICINF